MKLILDNIIFSLQRTGGISVVWNELLSRARVDKDIRLTELDYREVMPTRPLERYRTPAYKADTPAIFHSSYFRILPQPGVYNVTTVHDLTYHFYRHGLPKAVHLWEEQRALRHSEATICVSENTKRDLLRIYPWVKEEQVHVVYNGVSDAFYPIPSVEKKGYLLFIGNSAVAYKRFDVAQNVARLTGLELKTVSHVTQEQLNRCYNEALCLLYPSDYEGFGLPILEAQKAGCPVIAQDTSSIPEVMGPDGLMVEHDTPQRMAAAMAEQVRQLLSRPTDTIVRSGIENANRFSWDTMYRQIKHVYENICYNHHVQ
ncbi:MAG: glycosyltransferase family 4 protein [Paludibacteraceae bacterium]|nr:glycosyltransferase family 4 protein [Paludibacteraceae bacterium]